MKQRPNDKMKLKKNGKHWYIINVPKGWYQEQYGPEFGPYDSRAEAESDLKGLRNFGQDYPEVWEFTSPTEP